MEMMFIRSISFFKKVVDMLRMMAGFMTIVNRHSFCYGFLRTFMIISDLMLSSAFLDTESTEL